jgi:hypothetical protein
MSIQADRFAQRARLRDMWLGQALFAHLQGRFRTAEDFAECANLVHAEIARGFGI